MINRLFTSTLLAVALTAPVAFAKKEKAAAKKAEAAKVETFKIDTAASTIEWIGSKPTGSSHHGNIKVKSGELQVENKQIKGGKFVADMASLTNKDLEGSPDYKAKLEGHLKNEDFFNAPKYPESTYTIKSVEKKSDTEILVKGELTMIGKTEKLDFPATVKWEGDTKVVGTADVKVDRTKWGLKYSSGKFFKSLGDKMINDEFQLKLNLTATK